MVIPIDKSSFKLLSNSRLELLLPVSVINSLLGRKMYTNSAANAMTNDITISGVNNPN